MNPASLAESFELTFAGLDRTGRKICRQHNLYRNNTPASLPGRLKTTPRN